MIKTRKGALLLIFFSPILSWIVSFLYALVGFADAMLPWLLTDISIKIIGVCIFAEQMKDKSEFVERFPELSLFYRLFSPLDSEMICIFPYFCPYAESVREIREIFV